MKENPRYVIVVYLGDQSVAVDLSHGNAKYGTTFFKTVPSVLRRLEEPESTSKLPIRAYKDEVKGATNNPLLHPRNPQQVPIFPQLSVFGIYSLSTATKCLIHHKTLYRGL